MDENEGKEILLRYKDRKLTNYKIKFRNLVEKDKALVRKLKEKPNMDDDVTTMKKIPHTGDKESLDRCG